MPTLKTCSLCEQAKPLTDYYMRDGKPRARCKKCLVPARTPEQRAKEAEWKRRSRLRYGVDPSQMLRHGLTPAWYAETLAAQGGGCAVCAATPEENGKSLAVDHDHRHCPGPYGCRQCVRGLLCSNCNMGVGYLGDAPERLQAAAAYLRRTHRDSSTDRAPGTGP